MKKLTQKIAGILTAAAVAFSAVTLPETGILPVLTAPASAETPAQYNYDIWVIPNNVVWHSCNYSLTINDNNDETIIQSEDNGLTTVTLPSGSYSLTMVGSYWYYYGSEDDMQEDESTFSTGLDIQFETEKDWTYTLKDNDVTVSITNKSLYKPAIYDISISDTIANGTVTADKTSAAAGSDVTLTVTPDDGYTVSSVTYNDGTDDHEVTATQGVYSFEMPAGDVTVSASFTEAPSATAYTITLNNPYGDISAKVGGETVTSAEEGATVTLTVTCTDQAYSLNAVSYYDSEEHIINPVNGVYSFTMPAANVTVNVSALPNSIPVVRECVLTFNANGGSGKMDTITAHSDSVIALPDCTFTPPAGKKFKCWEIDGSYYDAGGSFVMKTRTAYAIWEFASDPVTSGNFSDLQALVDSANPGDVITLDRDYIASSDEGYITIPSDKTITIDLNGHTIDRGLTESEEAVSDGYVILVEGNLTLTDGSTDKTGTITGGNANDGVGVYVDGGTFTMTGGTISDNTADYGGGVFVYDGTFSMSGGTISDNTADYGGGVYVYGGTFTMSGGTISSNTANYGGGVYVSENGKFDMTGGTISDNTADYGGGVYVYGGTFTMSGGTISGNTADNGGGVYVYSNGTFTMTGGTISGNTAKYDGGGVYVDGGTFTMSGGTISGNTAAYGGGGVYVYTSGTFSMTGGTITGGNANDGGGVYVSENGKFDMSGGTISGNTANYGGGVYVSSSTFTMTDGEIIGNTAESYGGGVYVSSSTFTMTDGTISENDATYYGGVFVDGGTFYLRNGVTVSGDVEGTGTITRFGTVTITEPTGGTVTATAADEDKLTVGETTYYVEGSDVTLTVEPAAGYMAYGVTANDGTSDIELTDNNDGTYTFTTPAEDVTVTADFEKTPAGTADAPYLVRNAAEFEAFMTDTTTYPGTYIQLTDNIEFNSNLTIDRDCVIDFNGYTVSFSSAREINIADGEVTFTDNSENHDGGIVNVKGNISAYKKLNIENGTYSCQIYAEDESNSVITITGGTFKSNVYSVKGTLCISGGTFEGTVENFPDYHGPITVTGGTFKNDPSEFVDTDNYAVFTYGTGDDTVHKVFGKSGFTYLQSLIDYTANEGTLVLDRDYKATSDEDSILINKDITIDLNGHTIDRGLAESSPENDGFVIQVTDGADVTIKDGSDDPDTDVYDGTGKITGGNNTQNGGGVYVTGGSSLTLESGSISGNSASWAGGGVFIEYDIDSETTGKFTMTGGMISENQADGDNGGGVYVDKLCTFTMTGGTISGNKAYGYNGGGVYVGEGATFTMEGGKISQNKSYCSGSGKGGGVYVDHNGTFTMTGGTISGNDAYNGGGVYVYYGGTFTMSCDSCIISDNAAPNESSSGGGVFVTGGTFTMSGGTISENTAASGGGVYVYGGGTFTMSGGSISNNIASCGGGVCVDEGGTFKMSGKKCTISENKANYGGGVYVCYGSKFTMSKGTISGNTADVGGGGVSVMNGSNFTMSSSYCTISSNTAYFGGGVYVWDNSTFTMSNGTISGNTAYFGGGVNIEDNCKFTMKNGTISGNHAIFSDERAGGLGGGVSVGSNCTFTMSGSSCVISENDTVYEGGGVYVWEDGTFTMNGGTISDNRAVGEYGSVGGVYNIGTVKMTNGTISDNTGGNVYNGKTFYLKNGITLTDVSGNAVTPIYTVTVSDTTNGTVKVSKGSFSVGGIYYYVKGRSVTLTVTPAEGYQLKNLTVTYGNNKTVTVTNNKFKVPAGDVTVSAEFELPPKYTVTAFSRKTTSTASFATVQNDADPNGVVSGTSVTVTAPGKAGYSFEGWFPVISFDSTTGEVTEYDANNCLSPDLKYTFNVTENTYIVAVYKQNSKAKITVIPENGAAYKIGSGSITDVTSSKNIVIGTKVTITAKDTGMVLQWQDESGKVLGTGDKLTFTVTGKTTVTLVYKKADSTFVQFVSEYGQVLSYGQYTADDTIEFPAPPTKVGYNFQHWIIDDTATETTEPTIATESNIKALFPSTKPITIKPSYQQIEQKFTVIVNLDGADQDPKEIALGTGYTVTAPSEIDGKKFNCWKIGDNIVGYNTNYYWIVKSDITLTACYVPAETEVEAKPVITISDLYTVDASGVHKVSCNVTRNIPTGYKLVEHGILWAKDGTFNETTFILDGEGVNKYKSSTTGRNGNVTLNVKVLSDSSPVSLRGYMILKNTKTGTTANYYTAYKEGTYTGLTANG